MQINVLWYGNPEKTEYNVWWDMSILKDLFANQIMNTGYSFTQYDGIEALPEGEGAVVVIPSRLWLGKEEEINTSLQRLKFALVIVCGNEEGDFDFQKIRRPMLRIWIQLPRMNQHNDQYKLVNGYRPTTRQLVKEAGLQKRTIDYAFMGQRNHERRHQCVRSYIRDVLRCEDICEDGGPYTEGPRWNEFLDSDAARTHDRSHRADQHNRGRDEEHLDDRVGDPRSHEFVFHVKSENCSAD